MSPAPGSRNGSPGAWSHGDGRRRHRSPRRPRSVVANGYGAAPMAMTTPAVLGAERAEVPLTGPLDLTRTCARFVQGHGDPCNRSSSATRWRATRTPEGPATLRLRVVSRHLEAQAWGPGSGWALRAAPATAGARPAESFDPPAGPVRRLNRQAVGLRIPATGRLLEILVPTVIAQKVTGQEAFSAWRRLVRLLVGTGARAGRSDAPTRPRGPGHPARLPLSPAGDGAAAAETVRRVAWADWLEGALRLPLAEMYRRVTSIPGWGGGPPPSRCRWPPATPTPCRSGHLPNQVAEPRREPRGDDARMIDLLGAIPGHRQRVIRLVETVGSRPPAFGPRHRIRSISEMSRAVSRWW